MVAQEEVLSPQIRYKDKSRRITRDQSTNNSRKGPIQVTDSIIAATNANHDVLQSYASSVIQQNANGHQLKLQRLETEVINPMSTSPTPALLEEKKRETQFQTLSMPNAQKSSRADLRRALAQTVLLQGTANIVGTNQTSKEHSVEPESRPRVQQIQD